MAFAYFIALINHLIVGYKLPDGPLASENQFNQTQRAKIKNMSVQYSSPVPYWNGLYNYIGVVLVLIAFINTFVRQFAWNKTVPLTLVMLIQVYRVLCCKCLHAFRSMHIYDSTK